jgi:APA family basic amino acid/polyamine antiporter
MTVAGSRVYARMATDGELPRLFRAQAGVPRLAIAMQCTLALALMWSASFKSLLTYIGFTLNLCAAATVVGLIRIRLREGAQLKVVGWPLAPATFLLGVLWMA